MKMWIGAAMLAAVTAHAGPAMAQVQPPQDRIDTALARARQVGIPVALLDSKMAEGKAKGIPMERIAEAVERRLDALERASGVMKGHDAVGEAELGVAAHALESGVSEAVLQAVAESAPRERRAVAIAALTYLVDLGHVPAEALARVQDALARGPEALLNLPAEAGRRGGGPGVPPAGGGPAAAAGPPGGLPPPGGESQGARPGGPPAGVPAGGRGRP
jgi:hypothetical protein